MRDTHINEVLYARRSGRTNAGLGRDEIDLPEQPRLRRTGVRNADELDESIPSGYVLVKSSLLKRVTDHPVTPCRQFALGTCANQRRDPMTSAKKLPKKVAPQISCTSGYKYLPLVVHIHISSIEPYAPKRRSDARP